MGQIITSESQSENRAEPCSNWSLFEFLDRRMSKKKKNRLPKVTRKRTSSIQSTIHQGQTETSDAHFITKRESPLKVNQVILH